jgi:hypothetical protein
MSLTIIELSDTALVVTRDGKQVCRSPSIAVLSADGVVTGDVAQTRAHTQPRGLHRRFWQQLNERPLARAQAHCRHHADLAYHHLHAVVRAAGQPREAVLVVPSHYGESELALLLGIAQAAELKVLALVDGALAAVAGCAPEGEYTVIDIDQHHACLTRVVVKDGYAERQSVEFLDETGLHRVETAALDLIADALLGQARFDVRVEAAIEHVLHSHLPQWLAQATRSPEVTIELDYRGTRFSARVPAREFVHVTGMVLANVQEHIHDATRLLASARLAALPGALAMLAPIFALSSDAVPRALAAQRFAPTAQGTAFWTRLPANPMPSLAATLPITAPARDPQPTHLLAGNCAVALTRAPLYLRTDGSVSAAAHDGASAVALLGDSVRLRAGAQETRVNGVVISESCALHVGDHVTLAGGRIVFVPIVVSESSAP